MTLIKVNARQNFLIAFYYHFDTQKGYKKFY